MNKNLKKLLICVGATIAVSSSTNTKAFADMTNLEQYKLVKTYTLTNVLTNVNTPAYNVSMNGNIGDEINSPLYVGDVEAPTATRGTVTNTDGYNFNMIPIRRLEQGKYKNISIVQNIKLGTDYNANIDPNKVTSNFHELANYKDYLNPGKLIESDNTKIKSKAHEIVAGKSNPYDKSYAIFEFVNSHIKYEKGIFANKGALSALENGKGVCQEYAQLFVAMCRAEGIPARTVSGFLNLDVDNNIINDNLHMWAEVYMPPYGWVMVDAASSQGFGRVLKNQYIPDRYNESESSFLNISHANLNQGKPLLLKSENIEIYKITNEFENVNELVDNAILSKNENDIKIAQAAVNNLANSSTKDMFAKLLENLNDAIKDDKAELEEQQLLSEAERLLQLAEQELTIESLKQAETAWNQLPMSKDKYNANVDNRITIVNNNIQTLEKASKFIVTLIEKAEQSKLQADITNAEKYINSLPTCKIKNEFIARIDAIKNDIDKDKAEYQAKIELATKAVERAELSKMQIDVINARTLVNGLNDVDKVDLNSRLDSVQNVIDKAKYQTKLDEATKAVAMAEVSNNQTDVDNARTLVNSLNEVDKVDLNSRLDSVQNAIDKAKYQTKLDEATKAVAIAEGSKNQIDVDNARTLINSLNDVDKNKLNSRLDAVQNAIDKAKYQTKLDEATKAVAVAEASNNQTDVDNARTLVNSLNDIDKNNLNLRLDMVQDIIDNKKTDDQAKAEYQVKLDEAVKSVEKAESSKSQVDVDSARLLVNRLKDVDKVDLNSRLDTVQNVIDKAEYQVKLNEATKAVSIAEGSKNQTDVDNARTLVNSLNDVDKSNLNARLDIVQGSIDKDKADQAKAEYQVKLDEATKAVAIAEGSKNQTDVDNARTLVNSLNDVDKSNLNARLDIVQGAIDKDKADQAKAEYQVKLDEATKAVAIAEGSKNQTDVDNARSLVNGLNDVDKSNLNVRLDIVQNAIDKDKTEYRMKLDAAVKAVEKAELSKLQIDVLNAKSLISNLNDVDKNVLNSRLQVVQAAIDKSKLDAALKAVEKAENSKAQTDVDNARSLVNSLNNSIKNNLNARLDTVQNSIDKDKADKAKAEYKVKLDAAVKAVEKAESTKTQVDIDNARMLVNGLNDVDKSNLNARLDIVQKYKEEKNKAEYQEKVNIAIKSIEKAESSKLQVDVDIARAMIDKLNDVDKAALKARLDVVQNIIDNKKTDDQAKAEYKVKLDAAVKAVEKAESSKVQVDVDNARVLINGLNDVDKGALNARLQVVQNVINDNQSKAEYQDKLDTAINAVKKAENSKAQIDVDNASLLLKELNANDKENLNRRLGVVQKAINDNKAKEKAKLDQQKKLEEATKAVEKAELSKSKSDVNNASVLVDRLETGNKSSLKSRLISVKRHIENIESEKRAKEAKSRYENKVAKATNTGNVAQNTKTQDDIDNSRINAEKEDLSKKTSDKEKQNKNEDEKNTEEVPTTLETAEDSKSQEDNAIDKETNIDTKVSNDTDENPIEDEDKSFLEKLISFIEKIINSIMEKMLDRN